MLERNYASRNFRTSGMMTNIWVSVPPKGADRIKNLLDEQGA